MATPNQIIIDSPNNNVDIQTNNNQLHIISEVCNTEVNVTQPITTVIQVATPGPSGISGTSGTSGSSGTSGIDGTSGSSGSSGSSGTSGIDGTSGSSGSSGSSGTSGIDGTSGSSGASIIINNNTDNYILTATGNQNEINGETNLTFDGSTLQVNGGITATSITASIISASSGITGSLFGTSSWAVNALTASFVNTASTNAFVQNGNSFGATALLGTNDNQNLQLETSGSVRMTISSSGDVGIGTTSPQRRLHVDASGSANTDIPLLLTSVNVNNRVGIRFASSSLSAGRQHNLYHRVNTATAEWLLGTNAGETAQWNFIPRDDTNYTITLRTPFNGGTAQITTGLSQSLFSLGAGGTANQHLNISSSGNVGIGTTTPTQRLDVRGNTIIAGTTPLNPVGGTLEVYNNASNAVLVIHEDSGSAEGRLWFRTEGSDTIFRNLNTRFSIDAETKSDALTLSLGGRVGIGTSTATPSSLLQVRGEGTASATTALRVENSASIARLTILDDGTSAFNTNHLYVSSSGNVGIGTTSPSAQLHVSGSATIPLRVQNPATTLMQISSSAANSGSIVFFGTTPTSGLDLEIQSNGAANGGQVRIAGNGTQWDFGSVSAVVRNGTGNPEMFGATMTGTSTTLVQNPFRVQFNANQTSTAGYTVLRLNATHTAVGTGNKLLQTWEFGGTQRSVVNITGSIGVGITAPSASVHISSSLGLPPMLTITPHDPLPTTNIPTGTFMVSASVPPRPYMWDGTSWYAL